MNTCGTCKHLGEAIDNWDKDYKTVAPIYHKCNLLAHVGDDSREVNESGLAACVIDGSGYYAALCVKGDFGCNQWSEKPAENSRD